MALDDWWRRISPLPTWPIPTKDISFPDSVIAMLRGDLGQPPRGWPEAITAKALKGEKPGTERPARCSRRPISTPDRKTLEGELERPVSDAEFASWLMYPKVFTDFARASEE